MTQQDKELLIRDLCGRLPYGVKAYIKNWSKLDMKYYEGVYTVESIDPSLNTIIGYSERSFVEVIVDNDDYEIKPYLFPLSSMTDKELTEFLQIKGMNLNSDELKTFRRGETAIVSTLSSYSRHIDWLNARHFDYRGLIDKSLALDATELNIY